MTRKERYQYILDYFRKQEPHVTTELQFGSAFQLLVATLLSAQCTDKRINAVTPALFAKYPTAEAMAQAEDVLEYISSVSYPNAKRVTSWRWPGNSLLTMAARCPLILRNS